MSADPYAPPQAKLERPRRDPPMPRGIRGQIMCGAYVATASGVLTLLGTLRKLSTDIPPVYLAYNAVAALVVLGLGYGVARGGRTCSVLLLATFLLTRGLLAGRHGVGAGWPIQLLMLCCYTSSVIGTLRWHLFRDAHQRAASAT